MKGDRKKEKRREREILLESRMMGNYHVRFGKGFLINNQREGKEIKDWG
jgi:hypothetical protein